MAEVMISFILKGYIRTLWFLCIGIFLSNNACSSSSRLVDLSSNKDFLKNKYREHYNTNLDLGTRVDFLDFDELLFEKFKLYLLSIHDKNFNANNLWKKIIEPSNEEKDAYEAGKRLSTASFILRDVNTEGEFVTCPIFTTASGHYFRYQGGYYRWVDSKDSVLDDFGDDVGLCEIVNGALRLKVNEGKIPISHHTIDNSGSKANHSILRSNQGIVLNSYNSFDYRGEFKDYSSSLNQHWSQSDAERLGLVTLRDKNIFNKEKYQILTVTTSPYYPCDHCSILLKEILDNYPKLEIELKLDQSEGKGEHMEGAKQHERYQDIINISYQRKKTRFADDKLNYPPLTRNRG